MGKRPTDPNVPDCNVQTILGKHRIEENQNGSTADAHAPVLKKPKGPALCDLQACGANVPPCNVVQNIWSKHRTYEGHKDYMEGVQVQKFKKPKASAVRDFPPGCGRYASRTAIHPPPVRCSPKGVIRSPPQDDDNNVVSQATIVNNYTNDNIVVSQAVTSLPLVTDNALSLCQTKVNPSKSSLCALQKFPTRSIPVSAYRDFPFGCGRNAPQTTKEECLKAAAAPHQIKTSHSSNTSQVGGQERFSKPSCRPAAKATTKEISNDVTNLEVNHLQSRKASLDSEDQSLTDMVPVDTSIVVKREDSDKRFDRQEGSDKRLDNARLPSRQASKEAFYPTPPTSQIKQHQNLKISKVRPKIVNGRRQSSKVKKASAKRGSMFRAEIAEDQELSSVQLPSKGMGKVVSSNVVATPNKLDLTEVVPTASWPARHEVVSITNRLAPREVVPISTTMVDGPATRSRVREALRLFQALCRKLLQEEEAHTNDPNQVGSRTRVDLMASKLLRDNNMYVNPGKQIVGRVPGLEVGDQFHYRIELCVVGLHRQVQAGIDFLKQGDVQIATSIVASGGYEDDIDNGDVLIYTGQGGNNYNGDRRQSMHQKLERGNLALKNSMDLNVPVRVIRGMKRKNTAGHGSREKGKVGVIYTYDGLYDVEKYWQDRGASGYAVFKFQLRRQPGQPQLDLKTVEFAGRTRKYAIPEGLCMKDISEGKEIRCISVVNTIDTDRHPPLFEYTTKVLYPGWCQPTPQRGCDCTDGCLDPKKCFCAMKNGGEFPFNYDGAIVYDKPIVYECGPSCRCPPTCHNRVSQYGIQFNLEIFKTDKRGWGVRSYDSIPSGSFVCEYTGEILSDMEAEQRIGSDEYLFDIGNYNRDQSLWGGLSGLMPEVQTNSVCNIVENVGFTIDAAKYGNVGRFVNHSCAPNIYAQNVLYDHDDKRLPHIMLFAAENIPPMRELFYHYNYTVDQVQDSYGNIKKKYCYCGSAECTGRMY